LEIEEPSGPPRGLLPALGILGILLGAGLAGLFVFRLQPQLAGGTAAPGSVIMPTGVGSNTALDFSPARVVVVIGVNNTLTFSNKDTATHTVTATDNSFNSGDIKAGESWTYTFTTPGTFSYYCIYHNWMKGTVVVLSSTNQTVSSTVTSVATNATSTTTSVTTSTTVSASSTLILSSTTSSAAAGAFVVRIPAGTGSNLSLNYSPSSFRLVVGVNNTVTFVNQDSVVHTVTADDGSFNSGDIQPGQSWTHTFAVGTYSYHCTYHFWMKGNITVIA
jgi:plastocyanin